MNNDFSTHGSSAAIEPKHVAVLHGAGYVGGELLRLLLDHPHLEVASVTSRTFAGEPLSAAHPHLRGQSALAFSEAPDLDTADALLVAAEHGRSAQVLPALLAEGYEGAIVDLSADFRHGDPARYDRWYDYEHPAPELLASFQYGLPEVYAPYPAELKYVANPGCFATALALALWPLAEPLAPLNAAVTALTGASGSGTRPSATTHFPTREGNVRAYKVLDHQHLPEVEQVVGPEASIAFTPASGPWTRGIWGTAQLTLATPVSADTVQSWFAGAYRDAPLVRLWPDQLPELRYAARTPFCDLGWVVNGQQLVVGFAIDNLLKGAASQAIQNLNLLLDLPEAAGLLPEDAAIPEAFLGDGGTG